MGLIGALRRISAISRSAVDWGRVRCVTYAQWMVTVEFSGSAYALTYDEGVLLAAGPSAVRRSSDSATAISPNSPVLNATSCCGASVSHNNSLPTCG